MSAAEWMSLTKDVVTIVASIVGITVACIGLNTWRRQLYGQSKFEIARRLALAVRLFREELLYFRSIIDTGGEIQTALEHYKITPAGPRENCSTDEVMALKNWKYERLATKWNEVAAAALEAELILGEEIAPLVLACREILNEITSALTEKALSLEHGSDGFDRMKIQKVMYGLPTDEFGLAADSKLNALQGVLKPHLRHRRVPVGRASRLLSKGNAK